MPPQKQREKCASDTHAQCPKANKIKQKIDKWNNFEVDDGFRLVQSYFVDLKWIINKLLIKIEWWWRAF